MTVLRPLVSALALLSALLLPSVLGCGPAAGSTSTPSTAGTTPSVLVTATPGSTASLAPTEAPSTDEPPSGTAPVGDIERARVVDVTDGDTIRVRLDGAEHRVRYIGIDAPERGEPLAGAATRLNERLVAGERVWLERDVSEVDRFDRLLRHVWLNRSGEWLNVNAEIVRLGLAYASSYPPDTLYDQIYAAAEEEARQAAVGLWAPGY